MIETIIDPEPIFPVCLFRQYCNYHTIDPGLMNMNGAPSSIPHRISAKASQGRVAGRAERSAAAFSGFFRLTIYIVSIFLDIKLYFESSTLSFII
jgi:hypothetical protein